jgi:hypothetical protein
VSRLRAVLSSRGARCATLSGVEDPDLESLEREHGPALRPGFDDDEYDDLPVVAPMLRSGGGEDYPDLEQVPQEDWKEVLREFPPRVRRLATGRLVGRDGYAAAIRADLELDWEARDRRKQALERSAPPPAPRLEARHIRRRADRQVSFRMTDRERGDLERVALAYGVSSARLARMLTIRGVRSALGQDP